MKILPIFFLVLAIALVLLFFEMYVILLRRKSPAANLAECETARLSYPRRRYPMQRRDLLPLILITVIYAVTAFWGLGNKQSPQSFCSFSERGRYVIIEMPSETLVTRISYFTGLHTGNYFVQFSLDGENYTDELTLEQKYSDIFKWREATFSSGKGTKYIRIISDAKLDMGELCIYDWAGDPISPGNFFFDEGCAPLFDEQKLVPESESYLNSAYFDEIYHVRTAYEHIEGVKPYETSHPPLGKIIIGLGIRAFGLSPFGWRFMGVLFGISMLPALYVFIKNLFGSTAIAACGTGIFAFDFMHFVQTRIATIDTYGVFFTILMYLFMYRFITAPRDEFAPGWKSWLPLLLSGICFGLGAASKWTCIYAGAGLALIWLLLRIFRGRELVKAGHLREHKRELITNIFQCLLFFVAIPLVIYYLSYTPYGIANGMSAPEMYFDGDYAQLVVNNQLSMFRYHSGVDATHPYSSRWYQWIVDGRPILYYLRSLPENQKSSFAAFLNPLVCWGGLAAMLVMAWRSYKYHDGKALFIFIGYLAQLVPWMFISRITFEYHYFPCLIFLVLAICHMFNSFRLRSPHWKRIVFTATGLCIALFVVFYPVLTGIPISRSYTDLLAWIPGAWPF